MIRVFAYLAWRSGYNRLAGQLRQLRSPRYLAALALGLAYLVILATQQRPRRPPDPGVGARWLELLASLGAFATVAWGWIFGVERRVLAFTPAEVTFLFSGPVPRRGLIQYKLLRNQLLILFNSLLWTLILSHERFGASPWLRCVAIWVLLTTLSLHRLGASFVRTSLLEHGRFALRHRAVSLAVVGAVLVGVAWSARSALPELAAGWAGGATTFLDALAETSAAPGPRLLLAPFRALVRPLAAPSPGEWAAAMGPALLLLVLHYVWVLRSDTAFEEAAAELSMRRAREAVGRQGAASGTPQLAHRRLPRLLRLEPLGWPGAAILWKNLLAVVRTRRTRSAVISCAVGAMVVTPLGFQGEGTTAAVAGWLAAMWAGMLIVIGPQWVRNDLRSDLLKLDLLRSYPLRGGAVVAAETAASAIVLTAMQLGLLVLAFLAFLGNAQSELPLDLRAAGLVGAALVLPVLNYFGLLLHNGAALLYPAWVHLGSGRPGGVEALGQNMLMIVAYLAALAVGLAVPAAAGGGLFLLLRPIAGWWGSVVAAAVALGVLGLEARLLVDWLGGVFERTDPAAAGIVG